MNRSQFSPKPIGKLGTKNHAANFAVAVEPPCLEPTSGMYCPPIMVTITHPLGRINGTIQGDAEGKGVAGGVNPSAPTASRNNNNHEDDFNGDSAHSLEIDGNRMVLEVYYTIQHASSANQLSGKHAHSMQTNRHRYTGPFSVKSTGRVKISAYAVLGAPGIGAIQSNTTTALYVLDLGAPPPVTISTGAVFHQTPIQVPSAKAVPVQETQVDPVTGETYNTIRTAPILANATGFGDVSRQASGVSNSLTNTYQQQVPSSPLQYASPRTRLLMEKTRLLDGGVAGESDQLPHHDLLMLKFVDLPDKIHCFQPFDLQMYLVDPFGYPVSAPGVLGCKMAVSAEVVGGSKGGQHLSQQHQHSRSTRGDISAAMAPPTSGAPGPVVMAHVDPDGLNEPTQSIVPWGIVHNIVCSNDQTGLQRSATERQGVNMAARLAGGLDNSKWDAVAGVDSIVGVQGAHCGYSFIINSLCRAIVGLYDEQEMDPTYQPDEEDPLLNHSLQHSSSKRPPSSVPGRRGGGKGDPHNASTHAGRSQICRDPTDERSWKQMQYSFHFSADLTDPSLLPAFRIYEKGCLVKSVDTRDFHVGDSFAIKIRPNGRVAYFHNGDVVHTSSIMAQQVNKRGLLGLQVRIAAQHSTPAIVDGYLLDQETPTIFKLKGIVWHPTEEDTTSTSNGGGGQIAERVGVLRAWIAGKDFVPAVMRLPVVTAPIPRWGMAGISLAAMFALGGMGIQGSTLKHTLNDPNARKGKIPQISLLRGQPQKGSSKRSTAGKPLGGERGADATFLPDERGRLDQVDVHSPKVVRYPENPEIQKIASGMYILPQSPAHPSNTLTATNLQAHQQENFHGTTHAPSPPRGNEPHRTHPHHQPTAAMPQHPSMIPPHPSQTAGYIHRASSPDPVPMQVGGGNAAEGRNTSTRGGEGQNHAIAPPQYSPSRNNVPVDGRPRGGSSSPSGAALRGSVNRSYQAAAYPGSVERSYNEAAAHGYSPEEQQQQHYGYDSRQQNQRPAFGGDASPERGYKLADFVGKQ